MEEFFKYLGQAAVATGSQVLVVLGPALALAFLLHLVTSFVRRRLVSGLGRKAYLILLAWIGTPVHELGHLLFCLLFRHRITEVRLFRPDPATGTLGYVNHSYSKKSLYQRVGNFFIGIGPILMGSAVILLLARLLLESEAVVLDAADLDAGQDLSKFIAGVFDATSKLIGRLLDPDQLTDWRTWLFVYLALAVGSSMTLSRPDVKSATAGFVTLVGLIYLLNIATLWFRDGKDSGAALSGIAALVCTVMLFALIVNTLAAALLAGLGMIQGAGRRLVS